MKLNILSNKELKRIVGDMEVDKEKMNVPVYKGYYYFSPVDFPVDEDGTQFVVATSANKIIGILKFKRYECEGHAFVSEKEKNEVDNYLAIRYVDVHEEWKRKGVAKNLYVAFNHFLSNLDYVIDSPESGEGIAANMHKMRSKVLTKCKSFNSWEDFEAYYFDDEYEYIE